MFCHIGLRPNSLVGTVWDYCVLDFCIRCEAAGFIKVKRKNLTFVVRSLRSDWLTLAHSVPLRFRIQLCAVTLKTSSTGAQKYLGLCSKHLG